MFKSVFLKTIYDKRWSTLIWGLAFLLFCLFIVVLFPTFKESFGEALKDVPEGLKSMLGEASDYQHITGFIDIQVVNQMVFMTLIMGIILGASLLGGEESDGRLQVLLAQPVSRRKVYWQKFIALALLLLAASFGIFLGVILGALPIGELGNVAVARVLLATFMTWLVTLVFASLAFCIGAITGRRGTAGIIAGTLAFATFMVTTLAGTATVLEKINYLSPFRYFNTPSVIKNGLDGSNVVILALIVLVLTLAGWIIFRRRDIYQR